VKRVVVTGAAGFVGANLARRLILDGHEVNLFVRPGGDRWRIRDIEQEAKVVQVDLADAGAVERALRPACPDWVFHLAAYGAYPAQTDAERMVRTNIAGAMNLVQACLKIGFEAFVNTGSSSEYGFKQKAAPETECLEPNSDYGWTKAAATLFCQHSARRHKVQIPTLRLYSVYGPFEEPTRLMPSLVVRGLRGQLPPLADRTIARDYVYIDDVCEAYLKAATTPGQEPGAIYNVGSGVQTTLGEVVQIAKKQLRIDAECNWGAMPNRSWDTNVWLSDVQKIQRELAWKAEVDLPDGFGRLADWLGKKEELLSLYEKRTLDVAGRRHI